MIHPKLINPKSIVVIGGSDNIHSPGGRVLQNLIEHCYEGLLYVVNPKKDTVQGIHSYRSVSDLPETDLAIIAIPARFILETVKVLTEEKNTKGFIIFSAGFSEKDAVGADLEKQIVTLIEKAGGTLLGPNNIGLINPYYAGVFTTPIPKLNPQGVDLISGSGATAVFIIEASHRFGLQFSSVYTVGNSAQTGIEEILEYFDETYNPEKSSRVKLLYIESIKNPEKLLKHSRSLIEKGCRIAAIKAGSSDAGNRAASSHTGAMATPDVFTDTLFRKAGIIRCYGRDELIHVASVLTQKTLKGRNIAVITHAGGPAVMLTDVLTKNGLEVPQIHNPKKKDLLEQLFEGSTVNNPIDFLATGTADQLERIIEYCEHEFDEIDAMVVIFGSPGLTDVYEAYNVIDKAVKNCSKPVFPVMPSVVNVKNEIEEFIGKGNIAFTDEVLFGHALAKVYRNPINPEQDTPLRLKNKTEIQKLIKNTESGFLSPELTRKIMELSEIPFTDQWVISNPEEMEKMAGSLPYPVVQKVVGPVHKSDYGGVYLNVKSPSAFKENYTKLMKISGAEGILVQPMISGTELFAGAKRIANFPPVIVAGLGGIFVEVLKDIQTEMVPVSTDKALGMILKLKAAPVLKGIRGQKGIDLVKYAEILSKLSALMETVPEIQELDINPLLADNDRIVAVDARIKIEK